MNWRISHRVRGLEESVTVALHDRVQALRAEGRKLWDIGVGDPDFDTPEAIRQAAVTALAQGQTHYTASRGQPELLRAIAHKLREDNQLDIEPAQVLVTPSAKHALFAAVMTLVDPGDEVIIPTPSWVSYKSIVQLAGGLPVEAPLSAHQGYRITPEALARHVTPRSRVLLVNSPNNPTGRVLDAAEVDAVAQFARAHDLVVISDEIYERLVFEPHRHLSVATHPAARERTLTVNGFSKAYAMTGWRLGYLAGPRPLIDAALKVHQHTVSCVSGFVQAGGLAALRGDQSQARAMLQHYAARARQVVAALRGVPGIRCDAPEGGFYVFADVSGTAQGDGDRFADWLLSAAGVVVTPGSAFGTGGQGCIRIALTAPDTVLGEAMARMVAALADAEPAGERGHAALSLP